jgi:hypothetical protein
MEFVPSLLRAEKYLVPPFCSRKIQRGGISDVDISGILDNSV